MVDSYNSRRFPLFHLKIRADLTQFTSKCEKICVNFHGLKQEQRCVLCFETCLVIWKSYLAELLFLSHSSSSFSGSFTAMRRNDIRLKKRNFICQSTEPWLMCLVVVAGSRSL